MASLNHPPRQTTHESARAFHLGPRETLKRSVCACLLFESEFYEDGISIADRLRATAHQVPVTEVLKLAAEVRLQHNLRHAPLWLVCAALDHPHRKQATRVLWRTAIDAVCQRPDDLTELVAMYWAAGKRPLSGALKAGLAYAFPKFNRYRLAKYARRGAVRLRDVMFLSHPTPKDAQQAADWKLLADDALPPADTWEVALSAGAAKATTFQRLLAEGTLGGLATLRNLRNMREAGMDRSEVAATLLRQAGRSGILPFQYMSAARAVPAWEDVIEAAMMRALTGMAALPGRTALLVDVSGSMSAKLSERSDLTRLDAAKALAILLREVCTAVDVFRFDTQVYAVVPRHGFALGDAIGGCRGGTDIALAVRSVVGQGYDRVIVITDEQSSTALGSCPAARGYIMNVASAERGVGYGAWTHIHGFSEHVVRYVTEVEGV